jgi:valyl-tRNA synthetase
MDEVCARAVRHTFFAMFRDGLIFRGDRLVNWDCALQTAVADDELYKETVQGKFYYLRYPVLDAAGRRADARAGRDDAARDDARRHRGGGASRIPPAALRAAIVAQRAEGREAPAKERPRRSRTRPAAGSASSRRAAAPASRWRRMAKRRPQGDAAARRPHDPDLSLDEWADPTLGTGCVKITPAHDPNDYAVWQRHRTSAP